jgi:reversibly glycosylated polypeptide/UDP-arabinopyranose mutase
MNPEKTSMAVCISTNRGPEIQSFLREWAPFMLLPEHGGKKARFAVFVHEDHPAKEFSLTSMATIEITHTCQADIEPCLGRNNWIIPRKSGAARSFPMYLAWKAGFDYILTMDDDCLPPEKDPAGFFDAHRSAFHLDRWFRTIDGQEPRGIPYGDKGSLPVLLNHGLWTGIPDLDGPTALVQGRHPMTITLRARREIIPPGIWFPLCAMNVCYSRQAIPAAYNLLMGLEEVGFDRFDDIWSGLLLKRIADHLGYYITSGMPFVHHTKASNLFANLRKEALGIQLHEGFWQHVAGATLGDEVSVEGAYARLAKWIAGFPKAAPSLPAPKGYFERLSEAMLAWVGLFSKAE